MHTMMSSSRQPVQQWEGQTSYKRLLPRHRLHVCDVVLPALCCAAGDQDQMAAELERSKASVARLLKERDDLEEKLKGLGKELRQAINEKSVQVITAPAQPSCLGS